MKPVNVRNLYPVGTVLNTTRNSSAQQVYDTFVFAIQVFFTGTPTGSFKLQGSNDPAFSGLPNSSGSGLSTAPIHWSDVSGSSTSVTAAGDIMWNYDAPGYNWVRVVYTDTSGGTSTATITLSTFNGKGF